MLDTASLKKRIRHAGRVEGQDAPVDRVCRRLASLECGHLRARNYGQHIVIEPTEREKPRDRDAIARLTALGDDVYGLSFRRAEGGWEPMVLIDTLDEIVWEMVAAVTPDPPEVEESVKYETFDLGSLD
jgi:hypothetical protein